MKNPIFWIVTVACCWLPVATSCCSGSDEPYEETSTQKYEAEACVKVAHWRYRSCIEDIDAPGDLNAASVDDQRDMCKLKRDAQLESCRGERETRRSM